MSTPSPGFRALMDLLDITILEEMKTQVRLLHEACGDEVHYGELAKLVYRLWEKAVRAEVGDKAAEEFRKGIIEQVSDA